MRLWQPALPNTGYPDRVHRLFLLQLKDVASTSAFVAVVVAFPCLKFLAPHDTVLPAPDSPAACVRACV